jgi:hypothetical protein
MDDLDEDYIQIACHRKQIFLKLNNGVFVTKSLLISDESVKEEPDCGLKPTLRRLLCEATGCQPKPYPGAGPLAATAALWRVTAAAATALPKGRSSTSNFSSPRSSHFTPPASTRSPSLPLVRSSAHHRPSKVRSGQALPRSSFPSAGYELPHLPAPMEKMRRPVSSQCLQYRQKPVWGGGRSARARCPAPVLGCGRGGGGWLISRGLVPS